MQIIPPRLCHLLMILTESASPVSVSELAGRCGVSRRTIFREIENIDGMLKPFDLSVSTKVGEGVYLAGEAGGKARLCERLREQRAGLAPVGRHERRALLLLDLLTCYEPQKLFYYADNYKVSEATISHDLDVLEDKLRGFNLRLIRRPGYGVYVEGGEAAVRAAICAALIADTEASLTLGYPPAEILGGVRQLMEGRFNHHLLWVTEESKDALYLYMAVSAARIQSRCHIDKLEEDAATRYLPIADYFANSLELTFAITLNEAERGNLAKILQALRRATNTGGAPGAANDYYSKQTAYRMIEHFDPELAPFLKLDDRLVDGLALHMQSALARIRSRVVLNDPLLPEIARAYPDILEKCKRTLALEDINFDLSESEASFLATHFGAAVMRIREHSARRLKIGLVCMSGIGTSYFLASQLGKRFASKADIEICGIEDVTDWNRFDLLVTTIPLDDIPIPSILVSALLSESDAEAIGEKLGTLRASERQAAFTASKPLLGLCRDAAEALSDAADILAYFDTITIESNCDFDHLAKLTGYRFGGEPEDGLCIYEDIIRRESLSTQVVPELELILLHARTRGVKRPVFSLIVPEGGKFTAPALQGARSCVVMLVPNESSRDTLNLMGRISSALLEDQAFLQAVKDGDKALVYSGLENNFRDYLAATIIF